MTTLRWWAEKIGKQNVVARDSAAAGLCLLLLDRMRSSDASLTGHAHLSPVYVVPVNGHPNRPLLGFLLQRLNPTPKG